LPSRIDEWINEINSHDKGVMYLPYEPEKAWKTGVLLGIGKNRRIVSLTPPQRRQLSFLSCWAHIFYRKAIEKSLVIFCAAITAIVTAMAMLS
jgi:hypothetical protein